MTVSDSGKELGDFTVSVTRVKKFDQDCFLVHANSQGTIDGVPCALEVKQLAQDFITNENVPACHVNAGMLCDATLAFDKRGALAFSMLTTWIDEVASMRSAPDCVLWSIKPEQYFVQTGNYPQKPGSSSNSGAAPNFVVSTALLLLASFTLII